MKNGLIMLSLVAGLALRAVAQDAAAPNTEDQKILYVVGLWLGQQAAPFGLSPAELKYVQMGMRDYVQGKKPAVDTEVYGPKLNEFAHSRMQAKAQSEKKKSAAYLDKASHEKGAVKTASGIIYIEEKAGSGAAPKATDKVRVHYEGSLTDGTVFDSSIARSTPLEIPLNGVIPCWTEGLQKMKIGGKATLVCPSATAYGDQGQPPRIPGGATLVFKIQLLDILKK